MKIKDITLTKEDIKSSMDVYNATYDELITRKNILVRVVSKCSNKSKETLI